MPSEPLPQSLQKYINLMKLADKPLFFSEIVEATPGYNGFRHLRDRGLIKDITRKYKEGDPYTGPRMPMYILTGKGKSYTK